MFSATKQRIATTTDDAFLVSEDQESSWFTQGHSAKWTMQIDSVEIWTGPAVSIFHTNNRYATCTYIFEYVCLPLSFSISLSIYIYIYIYRKGEASRQTDGQRKSSAY